MHVKLLVIHPCNKQQFVEGALGYYWQLILVCCRFETVSCACSVEKATLTY